MTRPRGTTNRNARGGADQRRARKAWLLAEFGDGASAECALSAHPRCLGRVTMDTITVDRYPVPGIEGGTYRRGNIRPACPVCNYSQGGKLGNERRYREQQRK